MNFKFLDHKIIAAAQSDLDVNHQFSELTELLTHPSDSKKKQKNIFSSIKEEREKPLKTSSKQNDVLRCEFKKETAGQHMQLSFVAAPVDKPLTIFSRATFNVFFVFL